MIDEIYLSAAVRIKREYLDITSNLQMYEEFLKKTQELIEATLTKVDKISSDLNNPVKRKNLTNAGVLSELDTLLSRLDADAKRLETYVNPMNESIERLAVEESELYRQIKDRHSDLTDKEIVHAVSQRLQKEGLL